MGIALQQDGAERSESMTPQDEIKPYALMFILEQRHRVSTRPSMRLRGLLWALVIEGVALYVIWRVLMMLDK
jgi:hypothetical protein